MPQVTINIDAPFSDLSLGTGGLVLTPAEFKEQYLWGIPLCNTSTGQTIADLTFKHKIQAAQQFVEEYIGVKLFKQYVTEHKDFFLQEFKSWGYIQASYPINKIYALTGKLNERPIIEYPLTWLSSQRSNVGYSRNLYIVPNGATGTPISYDYLAASNSMWFNMFGSNHVPRYWGLQYLTGFDRIPQPLVDLVGKITAVHILPIIEQTVAGFGGAFGSASASISMDGLSQSVSKANGGNIFQQRIRLYGEEVKTLLDQMRNMYGGFVFTVV